MTAQDYPVTFPYGATDGTFYGPKGSIGPYHRGDDRYMSEGTLVLVNSIQIGLSGKTGAADGPHLHIGKFINGKDTNPEGQGFILDEPHVLDTGYDNVNGNYVRILSDGVVWVYLHLSKITVSEGSLKGEDMPITAQDVVLAYQTLMGVTYKPTDQPILDYANSGRPAADVWKEIATYAQEHKRDYLTATRADAQFVIAKFKEIFGVDLPENNPNVQIYVGAPKDYVVNDMFANAKLQKVDVSSLKSRLTEAQKKDVVVCTEAAVKASKYDQLKEALK